MSVESTFSEFFKLADVLSWHRWSEKLVEPLSQVVGARRNSDRDQWDAILPILSNVVPTILELNQSRIQVGQTKDLSDHDLTKDALKELLMTLHPWRKGPFDLFGLHIDTEWRSDLKWDRISPYISSLEGRIILDVGCGSGYHALRMFGQGARGVIAIDPSQLYWTQFQVLYNWIANFQRDVPHFSPKVPVQFLPIALEDMPKHIQVFDTVFSMGVLYHRKSPFEHLDHLRSLLTKGGEVIVETLVVEGGSQTVLVPPERYASMNNVWFLPSVDALKCWMERVGFVNVRCVDLNRTSIEEQRTTHWMQWKSLSDFLDSSDHSKTIEGHSAPLRATLVANRP